MTLSVASLECYANELWFEQAVVPHELNEVAAKQIAKLIDRKSILDKYSLALALRTKKELNFESQKVENVKFLIQLRNAVVHFRPEWSGTQKKHHNLSKQLAGKFQPSQFLPGELLFPRAWASKDFSSWAIRSTVDFLDYFYAEYGIDSPLEKFKDKLLEVSCIKV